MLAGAGSIVRKLASNVAGAAGNLLR